MIVDQLRVVSLVPQNNRSMHLSKFALISKLWSKSIQPVTYRESNLMDKSASRSFLFSILKPALKGPGPRCFITILSLSFYPGNEEGWWNSFYYALLEMINLKIFYLAYSHEIVNSIEPYASMAGEGRFSLTLEQVYMRLVWYEYYKVHHSFIFITLS